MTEERNQLIQQNKPSVDRNSFFLSKLALLLAPIWLLVILISAFHFVGIFRFLNVTPQETGHTSFYLSTIRLNLNYLTAFALINGSLVLLGLKWERFARTLLKFIDPPTLLLGIAALITGYFLPCEGLGCIPNSFLILGGVFISGSVLTHAPLLYLISNGVNRKALGVITSLFAVLMILVPSITYFYLARTLPKKAEVRITESQKELGITIFKPTHLPNKTVTRQFEGVRANLGEYYLDYYFKTDSELDIGLNITESKPRGGLEELLKYGGHSITINGNQAVVSTRETIQKDSRFSTSIVWVSGVTEIKLRYGVEKGTKESVEAKAIKIAESMRSRTD